MPCQPPLMQRQQHERQGPRPAQLAVTRNKVSKPKRRPVIIYVESPKVVHAHASEFRSVVQRLTGAPSSSPAAQVAPHQFPFQLLHGLATNMDYCCSAASPTTAPVFTSYGDCAGSSSKSLISFFSSTSNDQLLISPSTFLSDQNMVVAGSSFQQPNTNDHLLLSGAPFLPPSLGAANSFIDQ